jgi:phospholipase C
MDGADTRPATCAKNRTHCPTNPQFVYGPPSEVTLYFDLAKQYAFADRMFQTNQGPSFAAHQYIISGTSAPAAASDLFAAENPFWRHGLGK